MVTDEQRIENLTESLSNLLSHCQHAADGIRYECGKRDEKSIGRAYLAAARLTSNLLRAQQIEKRLRQEKAGISKSS